MTGDDLEHGKRVLAEATVYGFGLGQRSRRARLTVEWSGRTEDAIVGTHELQRRTDHAGVEWCEEDVVVVDPVEDRERVVVQPGYSEFPAVRIVCEWHSAASRAYVSHEERVDGEWTEQAAWEIHSATGVEQVCGGDSDGD